MTPEINAPPAQALPTNHADAAELGAAMVDLLAAPTFPALPPAQQIAWILHCFQTSIVRSLKVLAIIRSLVHFHAERLYADPRLDLAEACTLTESIYGLNWGDAASLFDMRAYDRHGVQPFRNYVRAHYAAPAGRARRIDTARPLRIVYFSHYADSNQGNSVGSMIRDLVLSHARSGGAEIMCYCVQWLDPAYAEGLEENGVRTRCIPQQLGFARLEELRLTLLDDAPDVVISDVASPIASWLFIRRVAPLQMYLDPGYPHWNLPELDWALLPGKSHQRGFELPAERWSSIRVRLSDEAFKAAFAARCPRRRSPTGPAPRFGVITRLVKITSAWLSAAEAILDSLPQSTLLILGSGDPSLARQLSQNQAYAGRIQLRNEMVDIETYQERIDIFLDTFPFVGGLVCRELLGHGVPVVSLLSGEWDEMLRDQRDPALLARSTDEYVALARQLADDVDFYYAASQTSLRLAQQRKRPLEMISDIEEGIRNAMIYHGCQ